MDQSQRIREIHDAAVLLFLRQGYAKTQISHIAKAVGVSVGTIYHDFAGKKELMHFILKCTLEPEFLEGEFEYPITDELFAGLEDDLIAAFEKTGREFSANLEQAGLTYRFEDLISDTFELLARYAVGCLFIEKNQMDVPRLAACYRDYRKRFFETMTAYIRTFISRGAVRPLEQVELSAGLIIELLSWWAMDLRYTSFEVKDIPPEQAKAACMDNILSAYQR